MARRTKEEALETREKLLASALEMMSGEPFSSVSMNKIAERVGLSKGAMYWHFKSKSDLLVCLFESMCSRAEEELKIDGAGADSLDDVRRYFRNKMEKAAESEDLRKIYRLMLRRYEWPEEVRAKIVSLMLEKTERERLVIENLLARSQKEGRIGDDVPIGELSSLIGAIFHGFFIAQLNQLGQLHVSNIGQYVDFILNAVLNALAEGRALPPPDCGPWCEAWNAEAAL